MQAGNALDELGNVVVRRISDDLFRGADLNHSPIFHDGNAVTDANGFIQVVSNEECGFLHHGSQLKELIL
ncbi:hypothetical protein D9M70_536970 [compost metagenome]